jgi:type IV secretory pathway VirB4 component
MGVKTNLVAAQATVQTAIGSLATAAKNAGIAIGMNPLDMLNSVNMSLNDAINKLVFLNTDVITSGNDSTNNTALS